MQHKKVAGKFKFDKDGITRDALFSGPVVLMREGVFLVAKSVTTSSAYATMALFGLPGLLIAHLFSSLKNIEFPHPVIASADLPDRLKALTGFGRLKSKHRIVVVKRENILGYTSSFLGGFKLICTGENIVLQASKRKLISSFSEYGYPEHKPEDKPEDRRSWKP